VKLKHYEPRSNFPFKINLRRYTKATKEEKKAAAAAKVERCSSTPG
jgi:hypothetical protein